MDLALSEEQQDLRDTIARLLAKVSGPEQVRAAEPLGHDPAVWTALADMGVPTMGVPEIGGAAMADLAVVARECGRHLAPAPVVEALVANRLLARLGLPVDDATVRAIALRPARGGVFTLVPGGAVAGEVVGLAGDDLVVVSSTGTRPSPRNLATAPLADVDTSDATVVASGPDAHEAMRAALDEWRALTAQWLVGLGQAAFAIGAQYVKDRHQFGVPVGSFQAVQHRLADLATELDGATLLVDKAVWALDTLDADDPTVATFPGMAFTFAGETAEKVAAAALHFHGGYGFMEEYDIQLHFRRAKATRLLLADPRRELQHLADRLFGPVEPATAGIA
jgi:alkylation response protein AidB-like acyl-CoA dehydrogenase